MDEEDDNEVEDEEAKQEHVSLSLLEEGCDGMRDVSVNRLAVTAEEEEEEARRRGADREEERPPMFSTGEAEEAERGGAGTRGGEGRL